MTYTNYDLGIIIPAKGYSRRLPNKNLLPFGNKPTLLEWKITQLLEIANKDTIYISSEDEKIKSIAKAYGVKIHDRAEYLSRDETPWSETVVGVVKDIPHKNIAWVQLMTPLMSPSEYKKCFDAYNKYVLNSADYQGLVSVNKVQEYFWSETGALNYRANCNHTTSDKLPLWYKVTNGLFMMDKDTIIKEKYYIGKTPYKSEVSKVAGFDIDYEEDYEICTALYQLYLKKHKNYTQKVF